MLEFEDSQLFGFTALKNDSALYVLGAGKAKIIVSLYVDDFLIASHQISSVKSTKSSIGSRFKVTDFGEVNTILGIKVQRCWTTSVLTMGQEVYA